jgi:hypothetical protein
MGTNDLTNLQPAIGSLLTANHHHDDVLSFDLYGEWTEEGGAVVETVMIAGTQHNVTTLLSGKQLENLGHYLDFRSNVSPQGRQLASAYRSQSTRY